MIGSSEWWRRKIAAFLFTPPDVAIAPEEREERARVLIAAALGEDPGGLTIPDAVRRAEENARGLDIPPIVETLDRSVFRRNPCIVHPLSGAIHPLDEIEETIHRYDAARGLDLLRGAVASIREEIGASSASGKNATTNDPFEKRLFLALWRKLPDRIRKLEKDHGIALGHWWDLLPADPCLPSHGIWDHAAVASAFAGAGETPALLFFTIGSAQEFVGSARRTQDFWMGSFLLSYLIWKGIEVVVDRCGPDALLYPHLHGQPLVDTWLEKEKKLSLPPLDKEKLKIANFPNAFSALVPRQDAEALARQVRAAIEREWRAISKAVREAVEETLWESHGPDLSNDTVWNGIWERQGSRFLEGLGVFWVVSPWGEDPEAIAAACRELFDPGSAPEKSADPLDAFEEIREGRMNLGMVYAPLSTLTARAMSARKNLRAFAQVEEPGEKCTLCGLREALHPEWSSGNGRFHALRNFWKTLGNIDRRPKSGEEGENERTQKLKGRIGKEDRLCAVCLTKRLALEAYFCDTFGFDRHIFPSTATLATTPFKEAAIEAYEAGNLPQLETYVDAVLKFLKKARIFYAASGVPRLEVQAKGVAKEFLRIDGDWLYEESFDPDTISHQYQIGGKRIDETLRRSALDALKQLLSACRDLKKEKKIATAKPARYYALVAMDGDKFSEWVAGKRAPRMQWIFHPDLVEGEGKDPRIVEGVGSRLRPLGGGSHLALSAVMKNYALHVVRWAVEVQHAGKLIYAGGDDVIAFVPLRDLFSLLRTLRILFQGESFHESAGGIHIEAGKGIATIEEEEGKHPILLAGGKNPRSDQVFQGPTASAGVALIHESHPLPYAMVEALHHAMKGRAKDRLGRDAFALHLHRRSGEPVECGMKWFVPSRDESAGSFDILEELDAFVGWFDRDDISSRLPYDMARRIEIFHCERSEEELAWYLDALREARPWYLDAQKEEFMRLLGRHTAETDEDTRREIRKHAERLVEAVEEAERLVVQQKEEKGERVPMVDASWERLTRLLLVARFIAQEG